jgi:integrase/recombinase XerD
MMDTSPGFPALLQAFFTQRLMNQRRASATTIASYRDAFCLLFRFVEQRLSKTPSSITMEDLEAPLIGAFLGWLETERGNSINTRNARLAAIHSFFKYAAWRDPGHSGLIQRVLAIPGKRCDRTPVEYLTREEVDALLASPDESTWTGRRDKTLLLVAIQTGLRVSELVGLNSEDVLFGNGAHVRCKGKGRKERCTPLRKEVTRALKAWLCEHSNQPESPLFPNSRGARLSRNGVGYLMDKYAKTARDKCPSLNKKRVTPHVLRHTAAMDLLQHGVDRSVIALWLGHETMETVQLYIHANLQMKEQALAKTTPLDVVPGHYRPDDELMAFLRNL